MDIRRAWTRLQQVQRLSFVAQSRAAADTGWNGAGEGAVRAELVDAFVMLFHERGQWQQRPARRTGFSNVFRWTVARDEGALRLEHLRFGPDQPVYLFDLLPVDASTFESSAAHVCQDDCYTARMAIDDEAIRLTWSIDGPKKSETISYVYR